VPALRSTNPARLDEVVGEFELADADGFVDACRAAAADFDEAMAWANGHGYGLSSSIYTTSPGWRSAFKSASRQAWCRSTTPRVAPRPTCRSGAMGSPGMAAGNPACGCWTK
jgi:hypothetical protein